MLEPSVYAGSSAAVGVATGGTAAAAAGSTTKARAAGAAACTDGADGAAAAGADAGLLELGPVTADDLTAALQVSKSSAQGYEQQYAEFSSKFGQAG